MGEGEIDFRPDVDETDLDRAVSASHLVLSAIPTIGPLIGEAVKQGIPNQRIDRIADMLKLLDWRLTGLQKDVIEQRMRTEEFRDLLEDGLWQATRALSEGRKAYIASLLKNSITDDELAHEQKKTLLSLLGQLNDSELITLGWYGSGPKYMGQPDEYRERHEEVLQVPHITGLSTEEDEREAALKEAYREKLRRLGLARPKRRGADEITTLGRLLLRQIDFYALEDSQQPT
jgi:hypothetical protein